MKREARNLVYIFVFILILIISTISMASASFSVGKPNHTIETTYASGDYVRGWINMSFTDESVNSLFKSSGGDLATLISLIEQNPSFLYTCSPTDCSADYSATNEEATKSLTLDDSTLETIAGFKITGKEFEGISTNGFFLNITSNAPESSSPQLSIDILNDGTIDWQSHIPSSNFKEKNYGCYVAPATGTADITQNLYCEKIHLDISPNLTIGAEVIDTPAGDGTAIFSLSIDDKEGIYASCEATATASGTVSCSPQKGKFRVREEKDYYVCIKAKSSADNNDYKINYERTDEICGYAGAESNPTDFEIFAEPNKYALLETISLNNTEMKNYLGYSSDIENLINNYISERYNNNCTNDCIIPIKISGQAQSLTLFDAQLSYSIAGISTSEDTIYDLQEADAKVTTAKYQKLNLDDAGFYVPAEFGDSDFTLSFKNQNIFTREISVEKIPRINSLTNNIVMAAYPATFIVDVEIFDNTASISKYEWIFDDGAETTTENTVTHTFNNIGTYNLTVKITDSKNRNSSRKFIIIAEVPVNAINMDLAEKNESIKQLTSYVNTLPLFYKNSIKSVLNLTEIETQLEEIQSRYEIAVSDEDYVNIMNDLMSINVPKNISTTKKAMSIPFYAKREAININELKTISDYSKTTNEEAYQNAVIAWNNENIGATIDFDEISANYDEEDIPLLRFFEVSITKKQSSDYDSYFIIKQLGNLKYAEDYSESETDSYDYITLGSDETNIIFSTTEDVDFTNLPAFVSPAIEDLSVIDINLVGEKNNTWIIPFLIILILAIGLVVYLIMQKWYRDKYEDYLFRNKNDLYNLVSYVQNARRTGINEKELMNKLKKAKWKFEQIRYVLRKSIGKNPGMAEIFKFKRTK